MTIFALIFGLIMFALGFIIASIYWITKIFWIHDEYGREAASGKSKRRER